MTNETSPALPVRAPLWTTVVVVAALALSILSFVVAVTHRGTAPAVYHGTTTSQPYRVAPCPTAPTNGITWHLDGGMCESEITINGVAISFVYGPDNVMTTWLWKDTCGTMGYDFSAPATPKFFGESVC